MIPSHPAACPLCAFPDIEVFLLPYPLFRHLDFSPFMPGPNKIGLCPACGLVFRMMTDEEGEAVGAIYRSEEYVRHEEPHTIVVEGYDAPVPASFIQARLLSPYLSGEKPAVLDIGCFDGSLLSEIAKMTDAGELCGYDVAPRPNFPSGAGFRFVSGALSDIEGAFDLVVMSHSMQYIADMHGLFRKISSLLKEGGRLFIQVPDYSRKACSLLLGDLHYHYGRASAGSIFGRLGFDAVVLDDRYFPRDALMIASPSEKRAVEAPSDEPLRACLSRIAELADGLAALIGERIGVLGTTIEASFVNNCLGERLLFFVDENPKKVGKEFQGKIVIHPASVDKSDHIIIPMGRAGEAIRERLSRRYEGSYTCL